ncbi:hypothetical protein AB0E77_22600 [Streptomyces sp. NPDC032940]|uniref:hypothetical protein n=1 Tax=Streptomyces sp. NPDC032940 TaxID=3155366 RepID=UPI0033C0DF38
MPSQGCVDCLWPSPGPDGIVSNSYFEAGTAARLPDRAWLSLYEPGTVRSLREAPAPVPEASSSAPNLEVDGWQYFTEVVDRAGFDI